MLDFLDALCRVLAARDPLAIRRQLRHPLARTLPPAVRGEAIAIASAGRQGRLAPTRALHFYYQTLQLLAPSGAGWSEAESSPRGGHPSPSRTLAAIR